MPEAANPFRQKETDSHAPTNSYDNLDRVVKTTYPDGTYEQSIYNRLDVGWQRDRAGRWTHTVFDANREMESVTDPAGRVVQFQRCQGVRGPGGDRGRGGEPDELRLRRGGAADE